MSRFSKAEAEARGWVFVHERGQYEVLESATQGRRRTTPATYRAEKYLSLPNQPAVLLHEEGETMGLLLERINKFEEQLERKTSQDVQPLVAAPTDATPLNDAGLPVRNVIVAAEREDLSLGVKTRDLSEEEWASRDKTDVIIRKNEDGDSVQVNIGGGNSEVQDALDVNDAHSNNIENRRTAERAVGSRKQIEMDPADVGLDAPQSTGTGTVIVRGDEDSLRDALERKAALKKQEEDSRVVASIDQGPDTPVAPEGAEALAGSDVGIQERGDLGSEIPPVGAVVGNTEFGEAAGEAQERHDEIEADKADEPTEAERRSDAEEAEAKSQGLKADSDDGVNAVRQAGIDAAQKDADDEQEEVEATEAAEARAKELDVDLSQVEGSGKDGRILVSDVEKAAEQD